MSQRPRRYPYAVPIAVGVGLFFPTLSLVPLGSLWLWQKGYLLYWAIIAASFVGITYLLQRRFLRPNGGQSQSVADTALPADPDPADITWSPAEEAAWSDVLAIARSLDVKTLDTQDAILALGAQTVRAVAKRLHPEVSEPLWQFTFPEAFAIIEQVSRRLGVFTIESIPLSDRMTVAQALSVYRWRGAVGLAEKAYDLWRLVRLANPLSAATHELRERLSKQMMQWGRDHVTRRLAGAFVKEVGRAAIDLYGGRLKSTASRSQSNLANDARGDDIIEPTAEPIHILIAGQSGAGKSTLVNALATEAHAAVDIMPANRKFVTHALRSAGHPTVHLIDSPGVTSREADRARLTEHALHCDLLLWVVPAHQADRDVDRTALLAIRTAFAARMDRRPPPMLLIISHIDTLMPFDEWLPPYDLTATDRPKSKSIRDCVDGLSRELGFGDGDAVPVNLAALPAYNIDAVWARIVDALPDAQRVRLVRQTRDAASGWDWKRTLQQASTAGRVLGRTLTSKQE